MISGKIIRERKDCPACFEGIVEGIFRYLDIYHDKEVCGNVAFLVLKTECVFHMEVNRWSYGVAKTFINGLNKEFIPILKVQGVKRIITLKEGQNDKIWFKFVQLFGFDQPSEWMYTERRI